MSAPTKRGPKKWPMWAIFNYGRLMGVYFSKTEGINEIFGPDRKEWRSFIRDRRNQIARVYIVEPITSRSPTSAGKGEKL